MEGAPQPQESHCKKRPHPQWKNYPNWPGDISVAMGDGTFINDHMTQQYGGREGWDKALKGGTAKMLGVYVPL